jgi:hypothetical protein
MMVIRWAEEPAKYIVDHWNLPVNKEELYLRLRGVNTVN